MSVKVAVTGAGGRMGRGLVTGVAEDPTLELTGATVRPGCAKLGVDAGLLAGVGVTGVTTHAFCK